MVKFILFNNTNAFDLVNTNYWIFFKQDFNLFKKQYPKKNLTIYNRIKNPVGMNKVFKFNKKFKKLIIKVYLNINKF